MTHGVAATDGISDVKQHLVRQHGDISVRCFDTIRHSNWKTIDFVSYMKIN